MPVATTLHKFLPPALKFEAKRQISLWRGREIRRTLRRSDASGPAYLGMSELVELQAKYAPPPPYEYSEDALLARGEERADYLVRLFEQHHGPGAGKSLEIGCMDGMVSATLQQRGWQAAAIDRVSNGFDRRATESGAVLATMEAERLGFADSEFDLTFSYDALEHIGGPDRALSEMIRVTRPGGLIYLSFGPLYNSALGLHAYREIRVPFCQFLFERDTLDAYCRQHGLRAIKYHQLNGWSLAQYRALWRSLTRQLERVHYIETWSPSGMELVAAYPSCFTSKALTFEELSVGHVDALFRVVNR